MGGVSVIFSMSVSLRISSSWLVCGVCLIDLDGDFWISVCGGVGFLFIYLFWVCFDVWRRGFRETIKTFFFLFSFCIWWFGNFWLLIELKRGEEENGSNLECLCFFFTCSFSFWLLHEVKNSFLLRFVDCMVQGISHGIQWISSRISSKIWKGMDCSSILVVKFDFSVSLFFSFLAAICSVRTKVYMRLQDTWMVSTFESICQGFVISRLLKCRGPFCYS